MRFASTFIFSLLLLLSNLSIGQCLPPQNVHAAPSNTSITYTWDGPIDTFYVEWGQHGYSQASGTYTGYTDTTITANFLNPCNRYWFRISRICNGIHSDTIHLNNLTTYPVFSTYEKHYDSGPWIYCQDSLYWDTNLNNTGTNIPMHIASPFSVPPINATNLRPVGLYGPALPGHYYFRFGGANADSALSSTTPWIDFQNGDADLVFYQYSNNTNNPGDNSTLHVDVNNGDSIFRGVYTYAGDYPTWKRVFIDLNPYFHPMHNKLRITFRVDHTTSQNHIYNNILIDEVYIGDSIICNAIPLNISRPNPSSITINRTSVPFSSIYQWGPTGFTPNNGQFGTSTVNNSNQFSVSSVPINTNWIYVKDSCLPAVFDAWRISDWHGPYEIDSTNVYALSGKVFVDADSNCTFSQGDAPLSWIKLTHQESQTNFYTSKDGNFNFLVNGNVNRVYVKSLLNFMAPLFSMTSPCSNDTNYFYSDSTAGLSQDFVRIPNGNDDIDVDINRLVVKQGDTLYLKYSLHNRGFGTSDSIHLTLNIDTLKIFNILDYNGFDTIPGMSHILTKSIAGIPSGTSTDSILISGIVDSNLIGERISLCMTVDSLPNEVYFVNNYHCTITLSVTAYDPNNKLSNYMGKTSDTIHELSYRINFQNLGNFPASTVRVVDTLPILFNRENVRILNTKHNCNITIDTNNVATFLFYNIQLPDSASDPEGSKGYIDFSVTLDQPMVLGDSVANRAHIFFDYQPAIITNWAWTKVVEPINCTAPDSLSVLNSTCTEVDLRWQSGQDILESSIEYHIAGAAPGTANKVVATSNPFTLSGLQAGKQYAIVVRDSCKSGSIYSSDTIQASTAPLPTANFVHSIVQITSTYAQVDFDASTTTGANLYYWDFDDGTQDTGISVTHNYLTNGTFLVRLIAENDCGTDTITQSVTTSTIVVQENALNKIGFYPNPANKQLTVTGLGNQAISFVITDALGKVVLSADMVNDEEYIIDIQDLAAGVYFIEFSNGKSVLRKKFVKH